MPKSRHCDQCERFAESTVANDLLDWSGCSINCLAMTSVVSASVSVVRWAYGSLNGVNQGIQLTTTWSLNAAYEHFWNKRWQTSVYGVYIETSYNSTANGCNNNWSYYDVGTRTQFNVNSQTYIGLDVIYTKLTSATNIAAVGFSPSDTQPAETRSLSNQSARMAEFRFHRNFYA